jgi:hypothetical protein
MTASNSRIDSLQIQLSQCETTIVQAAEYMIECVNTHKQMLIDMEQELDALMSKYNRTNKLALVKKVDIKIQEIKIASFGNASRNILEILNYRIIKSRNPIQIRNVDILEAQLKNHQSNIARACSCFVVFIRKHKEISRKTREELHQLQKVHGMDPCPETFWQDVDVTALKQLMDELNAASNKLQEILNCRVTMERA